MYVYLTSHFGIQKELNCLFPALVLVTSQSSCWPSVCWQLLFLFSGFISDSSSLSVNTPDFSTYSMPISLQFVLEVVSMALLSCWHQVWVITTQHKQGWPASLHSHYLCWYHRFFFWSPLLLSWIILNPKSTLTSLLLGSILLRYRPCCYFVFLYLHYSFIIALSQRTRHAL